MPVKSRSVVLFAGVLILSMLSHLLPSPAAGLPSSRVTIGGRGGDHVAEGFLDIVAPLAETEKGLLFFNPRISLADQGANEVNLGAGWRHLLFDDELMLGGNAYFDSRESAYGNRFSQLGLGLELLSRWVDARANYYFPEDKTERIAGMETEKIDTMVERQTRRSTSWGDPYASGHSILQDSSMETTTITTITKTTTREFFDQFESGRKGFDAEIGLLLPLPSPFPESRVFGGYYDFSDEFDREVSGPKGRLEIRAGSTLTLDAEVFDDSELNGTSWFVGARVESPVLWGELFAGKNPIPTAGRSRTVKDMRPRLTEMVVRDVRVQTDETDFIQNVEATETDVDVAEEIKSRTRSSTHVVKSDINFVDNDKGAAAGDGTNGRRFDDIEDAADDAAAKGRDTVYVYSTSTPYVDREGDGHIIPAGVTVWGEGTPVGAHGGKSFGGKSYPTVVSTSPAFIVNGSQRITGLEITGSGGGLSEVAVAGLGYSGDVIVDRNYIHDIAGGVLLLPAAGDVMVKSNRFENVLLAGLVAGVGSTQQEVRFVSNTVNGSLLGLTAANIGGTQSAIFENNVLDNTLLGITNLNLLGTQTARFAGNRLDTALLGITNLNLLGRQTAVFAGNTFDRTGFGIISLNLLGMQTNTVAANTVNGLTLGLIGPFGISTGISTFNIGPGGIQDSRIGNNRVDGSAIGIGVSSIGGGDTSSLVHNNRVSNTGVGIGALASSDLAALLENLGFGGLIPPGPGGSGPFDVTISDNTITDPAFAGIATTAMGTPFGPVSQTNATISGNAISGSGGWGIYSATMNGAYVDGLLIERNRISGGAVGIGLESYGDSILRRATVDDNRVTGAAVSGIDIASFDRSLMQRPTVSGNRITGGLRGIGLASRDNSITGNARVGYNTVSGTSDFGILVDARNRSFLASPRVAFNTVTSNGGGIAFSASGMAGIGDLADRALVDGNTVTATGFGVGVRSRGSGTIVLSALDNTLAAGGNELQARTADSGKLDLRADGNSGAGPGHTFSLRNTTGNPSWFRVLDLPGLSVRNGGAAVTVTPPGSVSTY